MKPINPQRPGSAPEGSVVVEYFIDETGRARKPIVVSTDEEHLGWAVLAVLDQWRFETPTRDGKPVLTRVSQTFRFKDKSG